MKSTHASASSVALGGILAALAAVIMSMGTLIPVATYTCPMLCICLLQLVLRLCGSRMAWAWYAAVSVLSLLLAPDKEAAVIFCFLGFYPILKPRLDKSPVKWLWKLCFFNGAILCAYWIMLHLLGLSQVIKDLTDAGAALTAVLLVMGNATFFLMDRLLGMTWKRAGGKR